MSAPTNELELRPATTADSPAIADLVFGVLREYGLSPDLESTDGDLHDVEASYARLGGSFDVLVDPAGSVVGCVGLYRLDARTCELRKMYLRPSVRGRGWGRRLLTHTLAQARSLGFARVTLETASVLKEAIALYERHGFRPFTPGHLSCRCDSAYYLDLDAPDVT